MSKSKRTTFTTKHRKIEKFPVIHLLLLGFFSSTHFLSLPHSPHGKNNEQIFFMDNCRLHNKVVGFLRTSNNDFIFKDFTEKEC